MRISGVGIGALVALAGLLVLAGLGSGQIGIPYPPQSITAEAPFQPVATVYEEDFEDDDGGWTQHGTGDWQHGTPHAPPTPQNGENAWGTSLDGDHGTHACSTLESPPIQLDHDGIEAPVDAAHLQVNLFLDTRERHDGAIVELSHDGGHTWELAHAREGYDEELFSHAGSLTADCLGVDEDQPVWTNEETDPDAWRTFGVDVTEHLGGEIQVRLVFASNEHDHGHRGAYVDHVQVALGAGAYATAERPPIPDGAPAAVFVPLDTVYEERFEDDDGGWEEDGTGAWEHGTPTAPPQPRQDGPQAWGTTLDGAYEANACSTLTSPPIQVPGHGAETLAQLAQLRFELYRDTVWGHDGAVLEASIDQGDTWQILEPNEGYDRSLHASSGERSLECLPASSIEPVWTGTANGPDDWAQQSVDVTHLLGEEVLFRFTFASNEDPSRESGVYVDDVRVQLGVGAPIDPPGLADASAHAPGWEVTGSNPSWGYGVATAGPLDPRPVWGTNLHGSPNKYECSAIESPEIDASQIPGLGRLELTFEHHYYMTYQLGGIVQASADGGDTWETMTPVGGYPKSLSAPPQACLDPDADSLRGYSGQVTYQYEPATVTLRGYEEETLKIRFAFAAGTDARGDGWNVRNVALTKGAGFVPLTPASTDLVPPEDATAGPHADPGPPSGSPWDDLVAPWLAP